MNSTMCGTGFFHHLIPFELAYSLPVDSFLRRSEQRFLKFSKMYPVLIGFIKTFPIFSVQLITVNASWLWIIAYLH